MIVSALKTTRDTFAVQDHPATRYASTAALVLNGTTDHVKTAYLYVAPPPKGVTIVSAVLHLFTSEAWSGTNVVTVKRVVHTWAEKTLDWTNRPDNTGSHAASVSVVAPGLGADIAVDVSDIFQDVANGQPYYGFQVQIDVSGDRRLHDSESAKPGFRPYLDLEYSTLPEAAGDLSPNGVVVYEASPALSWSFLSRTPGESQAQSQVQVTTADDTDFSSPVYDSGMVTNLDEGWSLDGEYSLTDGTDYIWRVTVMDAHGATSEPSDAADLNYSAASALVITNPASDGDDVEDSTPTFTWTFSDETTWAAALYHRVPNVVGDIVPPGNPTLDILVDKQALVAGTDLDWTGKEGAVAVVGDTYILRISATDSLNRPGPVVAERRFVFVANGSVTAPTFVSAVSDGPGVKVEWTAATPPDLFGVRVDGQIVDWVDPADVLVSGTSYAFTTFYGQPGAAHVYDVVAKTTGVGVSAASASASVTPQPVGIWLVNDDLRVYLTGQADNPAALQQAGDTFYLLNRTTPVRIVGPVQGYTGHVSGFLHDYADVSLHSQVAALKSALIQDDVLDDLRLIWGNQSMAVIVGNVVVAQSPQPGNVYTIDFDWWSTDGAPA